MLAREIADRVDPGEQMAIFGRSQRGVERGVEEVGFTISATEGFGYELVLRFSA